jgi:membrane protease YdiL (CAAX protease family)
MEATEPMQGRTLGSALLAVTETVAALAGCMLVSLAFGVVLVFFLVTPRYSAELELEPYGDGSLPMPQLIHAVDGLGTAERVEAAHDGTRQTLIFTGLASTDFPTASILETLSGSGYRAIDHTIRRDFDRKQLLRRVGAPLFSVQALVFLVVGGLLARLRLRPPSGPPARGNLTALGLGVVAGLAAFAISLALGTLLAWLGFPVREQPWVLELLQDRVGLLRLLPWIVFVVPVAEEVFFRGYVFRVLTQRAGLVAGIAISSAMFSAVHLNPSGFVIYLGIGTVLAWIYYRTGNLLAPIAAHMVHNSIVLGMSMLATTV